jgi:hypothetical protein
MLHTNRLVCLDSRHRTRATRFTVLHEKENEQ